MPTPLVECIPNFSEARNPDVVAKIVASISQVPGVYVLDQHSDLDHNRTVVTYVGSPEAVEEAAFQAIRTAGELIDLNHHTGEHPRIGATDVVPFVPISDVTMVECVEMARRLGQRVGNELNIPIYLYEEAATRPERQNLENIRRGQFEGLKEEIKTNPDRQPDFGPSQLGAAGATVVGARQPLIAFNAYLTTSDVSIAQKVAKAVRHSSGGLRFCKALGLLVEGRAQVSMNLTNFHQTPIHRVVEMIRSEAARYGVAVHHTELVGLVPQEALINTSQWYLQMDQFESKQLLEQRLYAVLSQGPKEEVKETSFLDELASGSATPGGGSAAAHSGAAGAALMAMVARLTVGKKKYAQVEGRMWEIIDRAEEARRFLSEAVVRDSAGYEDVMAAFKLPKDTPEQQEYRARAVERATLNAANVPMEVAQKAVEVMEMGAELTEIANINAMTDAATGTALAFAALTGAALNVKTNTVNLETLQDEAAPLLEELKVLEARARDAENRVRQNLMNRAGIPA